MQSAMELIYWWNVNSSGNNSFDFNCKQDHGRSTARTSRALLCIRATTHISYDLIRDYSQLDFILFCSVQFIAANVKIVGKNAEIAN